VIDDPSIVKPFDLIVHASSFVVQNGLAHRVQIQYGNLPPAERTRANALFKRDTRIVG
jgi:hypothetical protein